MPKVGRSHFPYTPAGIKAAKKFAKMTGQKMVNTQPTEYMMSPQAQFAGLVPQMPMKSSKMDPDKKTEKVDNAKEEKADKLKAKKSKKR